MAEILLEEEGDPGAAHGNAEDQGALEYKSEHCKFPFDFENYYFPTSMTWKVLEMYTSACHSNSASMKKSHQTPRTSRNLMYRSKLEGKKDL